MYYIFKRRNYLYSRKYSRCILESKGNYRILVASPFYAEGCLVAILLHNSYLMISREAIREWIHLLSSNTFHLYPKNALILILGWYWPLYWLPQLVTTLSCILLPPNLYLVVFYQVSLVNWTKIFCLDFKIPLEVLPRSACCTRSHVHTPWGSCNKCSSMIVSVKESVS